MTDPNEKDMCDCCKYVGADLKEYDVFFASFLAKTGQTTKSLCRLCADSMAGIAYEYSDQYPNSQLYGVVCHVGNVILAEMKKGSAPTTPQGE